MPRFAGFLYDDSGTPVSGATVNLYAKNTTTPVVNTDTTDANGFWEIDEAVAGEYDIEVVNGESIRRVKHDTAVQLDEAELNTLILTDFTNAQHDHADATGGGQVAVEDLATVAVDTALVLKPDGLGRVEFATDNHSHTISSVAVLRNNSHADPDDASPAGDGIFTLFQLTTSYADDLTPLEQDFTPADAANSVVIFASMTAIWDDGFGTTHTNFLEIRRGTTQLVEGSQARVLAENNAAPMETFNAAVSYVDEAPGASLQEYNVRCKSDENLQSNAHLAGRSIEVREVGI